MIISVSDVINKLIIDEAREEIKRKDRDYSHFHPSEWDGCKRKIAYSYYEAKGFFQIEPDSIRIDPKSQRIFQNGHYMHDRYKNYLEKTNSLKGRWKCKNHIVHLDKPRIFGNDSKIGCLKPKICECGSTEFEYLELSVYDGETLWGGHIDAVVNLELLSHFFGYIDIDHDHEDMIIDFKTMNSFQFKKLEEALTKHVIQISIYMYITGIKCAKLIYENKDSQDIKEFLVKFDQSLMEVEVARAIDLKNLVQSATIDNWVLPERAYADNDNYECGYCKYKADCWSKTGSIYRKTNPPKNNDLDIDLVENISKQPLINLEINKTKRKTINEIGDLDV